MQTSKNGRTILVGEDEMEVRGYLEMALKCLGYAVELAQDGDEVLSCLQSSRSDIADQRPYHQDVRRQECPYEGDSRPGGSDRLVRGPGPYPGRNRHRQRSDRPRAARAIAPRQ